MKLPKLLKQAESALILSIVRTYLVDQKRYQLSLCLLGIRVMPQKYTLLVDTPIAKAELSLVSENLQLALGERGFTGKLIIGVSTGNI